MKPIGVAILVSLAALVATAGGSGCSKNAPTARTAQPASPASSHSEILIDPQQKPSGETEPPAPLIGTRRDRAEKKLSPPQVTASPGRPQLGKASRLFAQAATEDGEVVAKSFGGVGLQGGGEGGGGSGVKLAAGSKAGGTLEKTDRQARAMVENKTIAAAFRSAKPSDELKAVAEEANGQNSGSRDKTVADKMKQRADPAAKQERAQTGSSSAGKKLFFLQDHQSEDDGKDADKGGPPEKAKGKDQPVAESPAPSPKADDWQDRAAADARGEACTVDPLPAQPLPKRCHLAPNYFAGAAAWQRRLQALAQLPPRVAELAARASAAADLQPPETSALSVSARLDRAHIAGAGLVWLRIALRSTDRWGMRRPPFDLAVVVGPSLGMRGEAACKSLESIASYLEPQDRLTIVVPTSQEHYDGLSGAEALQRVRALCSSGAPWGSADVASSHATARQLLATHAAAHHRVAGTRAIVLVAAFADLLAGGLADSAAAAVQESTLTSILLAEAAAADTAWHIAELGHGMVELAPAGQELAGARALWQGWGRVVARLIRVDIRLAANAVAYQVLGSRVLTDLETQRVRLQEQAVDQNLARVAGVQRDRDQDGEGMTMLIPAFLGSDEHVIDMQVQVSGPGPVADVVVDYKDLVRMANQKAMARAALADLPQHGAAASFDVAAHTPTAAQWSQVSAFRSAVLERNRDAMQALLTAWQTSKAPSAFGPLAAAIAAASTDHHEMDPLVAAIDAWSAAARGCHVTARYGRR
ncbi:MAG: hypothetical protein EXR77_15715 [Myxococcales bacterium]|nr:hypothetical protein [Myxococcales bacterium]